MLKKFARNLLDKVLNHLVRRVLDRMFKPFDKKASRNAPKDGPNGEAAGGANKSHPWRICPAGEHWVRTHSLTVPPSPKNPDGITTRHGHCARNPFRHGTTVVDDYLEPDEMDLIAETHFGSLTSPVLGKLTAKADQYDPLIRGWTKYWNDIFQPGDPLDPNLVKALIASESSFNTKPKDQKTASAGMARGLMQLTDQAIHALGDPKGALRDHMVKISEADTSDPNRSIAAGVRWLFRKRELASHRLHREATWGEAVAEYKGYLKDMLSGIAPNPQGMIRFHDVYESLKNGEAQ